MRISRVILLLGVVAVLFLSMPSTFVGAAPVREFAVVKVFGPVRVMNAVLNGTYVFEHDTARMARGEPCTAIYEFKPDGSGKKVVAFHCIPQERPAADCFRMAVLRNPELAPAVKLTEFQFAGSTEAHGVPRRER